MKFPKITLFTDKDVLAEAQRIIDKRKLTFKDKWLIERISLDMTRMINYDSGTAERVRRKIKYIMRVEPNKEANDETRKSSRGIKASNETKLF